MATLFCQSALANPDGMNVARGNVSAVQNGLRLDISASRDAVIDWRHFNINSGETTSFHQPNASSVVWNRIFDNDPSKIFGNLTANGYVILMNQNGFYFGNGSVVHVNGLVVTTRPVPAESSYGGGLWQFTGQPPAAKIENFGEIKASTGGSLFLISDHVENHGTISAPKGTVGLYAGKDVMLSERPDGRGVSVNVKLPAGSVDNNGRIIADAGTVALHAAVVNQNGLVQANSVRQRNGIIELVASDAINLGPGSSISAQGESTFSSDAGSVTIKSDNKFTDAPGSQISVRGGSSGGNAGAIEVSAPQIASLNTTFDGSANVGFTKGKMLLDPTDISLYSGSSAAAGSGTVDAGASPPTLRLDVNSFASFAQISLQATHDITFEANTVWKLADRAASDPPGTLSLEAGRNILFNTGSRISAGQNWSLSLSAGVDFPSLSLSGDPSGSIYLNGGIGRNNNGSLSSANGDLTLWARKDVLVGQGFIQTTAGGNIKITTVSGNVDAGTNPDNYQYGRNGSVIGTNPDGSLKLGGIATAAGGNVDINAGHDILSFTPLSGAYGSGVGSDGMGKPTLIGGNVNLTAGNDIKGKFTVHEGAGTIHAQNNAGTEGSPLTLALVHGAWNVNGNNINLREVFNPNGTFNNIKRGGIAYRFDYDPGSSVTLNAVNSVLLLGTGLERRSDNMDQLPIYPPILNISAGAGGVTLGSDMVLYPSAVGQLDIATTAGGSLRSRDNGFYQLIMSDSALKSYRDNGLPPANPSDVSLVDGHAVTPVHLNDKVPAKIDLEGGGNIENIFLRIPKAADIKVTGDAKNFSYEGQNLSDKDETKINITGDVVTRSDRTFMTLSDEANFDRVFNPIIPLASLYPDLAAKLTWNPLTRRLGFSGIMQAYERDILLHPMIEYLDANGFLAVDALGLPLRKAAVFSMDAADINALYAATQDVPTSPLAHNGIQIGGPGKLTINAHNLDLGTSQGIRSLGPQLNDAIFKVNPIGADISLNLSGDLKLVASQIASFNGGNIDIHGQGKMDIGSQEQFTSDDTPKGIYTGNGGAITVEAKGDILINGSRIATYNGGNVSVTSHEGNVDAGAGARGSFTVSSRELDPKSGDYINTSHQFFGSGIGAFARLGSRVRVGDISVTTDKGDILANAGGIIQLAFNNYDQSGAKVNLYAALGDIKASESGILGVELTINAPHGNVAGKIVGAKVDVNVPQGTFSGTILSSGAASVTAGGSVSGTIAGSGAVSVSAGDVSGATVVGGGGVSGDGAKAGSAFSSVAAPTATKTTEDASKTTVKTTSSDEEEEKKKRAAAKSPLLAKTTGRVTVILPNQQK